MKTPGRLLVVVPFFFAACASLTVSTDYDRNTKFANYKTFAFAAEPKTQTLAGPAVQAAIHDAVESELSAKGFAKAAAKPDFYVVYHITEPQKADVQHYTDWGFGAGGRPGYGFYGGWPVSPKTYTVLDLEPYKSGALVLDFVDARRSQLIWRSVSSSVVGPTKQNADAAALAVKELLAKFPPPVAK
jgi:hypothetical protein